MLSAKGGEAVTSTSSGIAWESDTKFKFRNSPEGSTGQFFPPFAYERQAGCDTLSGALKPGELNPTPTPTPTPTPNQVR